MGCFLACFGLKIKKKKKPRKSCKKRSPLGQQDHGSYVPLHSHLSNKLDIQEYFTSDSNQLKEKAKEKIKKKVSFNLNVMAYEPIPHDEEEDEEMCKYLYEGAKWEFNTEGKNAIASSHRYQNCRDGYDEEDNESGIEDSYYDDDDEDDDDEFVDVYSSIEEDVNQTEAKRLEPNLNVGARRQYVLAVLNPVENLSQWRQVKAKTGAILPPLKMCEKENIN